jgi:opacity protein-like surface antigen
MVKKRCWIGIAACCFSFLFIQSAAGQGFYIGPQVGYSLQKPSLSDIKFSTDSSLLYGARAGVKILMFALELNYFQAAHNFELKELVTFDWADREIDYNYLGLNAKVYFPMLLLHPYLTAGYGYYHAKIFEIDEDTAKGFNFGGGLELQLGDKFALLAEGKYHHVTMEIDGEELKIRDFTIVGGFNFFF